MNPLLLAASPWIWCPDLPHLSPTRFAVRLNGATISRRSLSTAGRALLQERDFPWQLGGRGDAAARGRGSGRGRGRGLAETVHGILPRQPDVTLPACLFTPAAAGISDLTRPRPRPSLPLYHTRPTPLTPVSDPHLPPLPLLFSAWRTRRVSQGGARLCPYPPRPPQSP